MYGPSAGDIPKVTPRKRHQTTPLEELKSDLSKNVKAALSGGTLSGCLCIKCTSAVGIQRGAIHINQVDLRERKGSCHVVFLATWLTVIFRDNTVPTRKTIKDDGEKDNTETAPDVVAERIRRECSKMEYITVGRSPTVRLRVLASG